MKHNSNREEFFDSVPPEKVHQFEELVELSQEIGQTRWLKGKKNFSFVLDVPPATGVYYVYSNGILWFPLRNFQAKDARRYYEAYEPFLREIERIFAFRACTDSNQPPFPIEIILDNREDLKTALLKLRNALRKP